MVRELDRLMIGAKNLAGRFISRRKTELPAKRESGASGIIVEVGILLVGVVLVIAYRNGVVDTMSTALNNAFSTISNIFNDVSVSGS